MRGILAAVFFVLITYGSVSAHGKGDTAKKEEFVLVVPFMPQMYEASGDYFICKHSNITPGQLSEMIRRSLVTTLVHNLGQYYNAIEVSGNNQPDNYTDMGLMYKAVKIGYRKRKIKAYFKDYPSKGLFASNEKKWGSDCINNGSERPNEKKHKYADPRIVNDSVFTMVCERNKAAYVLMITQFEMYTRFKNCLDMQESIYQRDFYVHYALFSKDGKKIDGGVVATTWESDTKDAKTILEQTLGNLSGLVMDFCRKYL
jgi:hypothetical protein